MLPHEHLDARGDLPTEAGAVEDSVMPDNRLKIGFLLRYWKIRREIERGKGLAAPGDVVLLPLDGHQSAMAYLPQIDGSASVLHETSRKQMADED
jgi:hypothetical protein